MQGYGLFHSAGHILPIMNSTTDTNMKAPIKYHQTPAENGERKENKLGGVFVGFLYKMLIPVKRGILCYIRQFDESKNE